METNRPCDEAAAPGGAEGQRSPRRVRRWLIGTDRRPLVANRTRLAVGAGGMVPRNAYEQGAAFDAQQKKLRHEHPERYNQAGEPIDDPAKWGNPEPGASASAAPTGDAVLK